MNFNRKAAMFTHYAARWYIIHSAKLHTSSPNIQNQNVSFQLCSYTFSISQGSVHAHTCTTLASLGLSSFSVHVNVKHML